MKKIAFFSILIVLVSFKTDNKILWKKSYDFPLKSTWITKILPFFNNGYIFIGNGEDIASHPGIIAKLDNNGNMIWSKIFENHHFDNLILTNDENIIITGFTAGVPFILKLDNSGIMKWRKVYDSIDNREYKKMSCSGNFCVKELSNGDFIATVTNMTSCFYPEADYVSFIFRTNSLGEIQWDTSFVNTTKTIINSIEVGYKNDYFLCDSRNDSLRITRYDSTGRIDWSKLYYSSLFFYGSQVIKIDTQSFLIAGVAVESSDKMRNRDIAILKINEKGDVIWYKTYDAGESEILYQLKQFKDNDLGIIAESNYKIYALMLDNNGEIKWNQRIDVFSKNGGDIIETHDSCLMVGCMNNFKPYVVKLDTIRDQIAYSLKSGKINEINYSTGLPRLEKQDLEMSCFPNPFDKYLNIESSNPNCKYTIYDINGRFIKSGIIQDRLLELNTENFKRGSYIVKSHSKNKETIFKIVK